MDIFTEGSEVTLAEVLANKDWREAKLAQLQADFPNQVLVSVKLNIPGSLKNNQYFQAIFAAGWQEITKLTEWQPSFAEKFPDKRTGPEGFLVVADSQENVKRNLIQFEGNFLLGRLFDADVYAESGNKQLSRTDLGFPKRKCFVCDQPAKECARSGRHTADEIKQQINQKYEEYFS